MSHSRLTLSLLLLLALASAAGSSTAQPAQDAAPLVLDLTIPLARVSGRIDHLAVDVQRRRIFLAELGNGSVDAVDLSTSQTRRIGG
jgi:hypothetical protein